MKYALLLIALYAAALISCTDDLVTYPEITETPIEFAPIEFTPMELSSDEQRMIDENLALITEYYAEKEPEHFLILVGNKETLVDDMSCNEHDQAVIKRMLSGGTPKFLHLAPKEEIPAGALNKKYADAPEHIKDAIKYVNEFSRNVGAVSDDGALWFNYKNEERGIVNGECQDLGVHHLGLFKDTQVVREMNNAGYGTATWNGLPVYASYSCNSNWNLSWKNTDNGGCKQCKSGAGGWTYHAVGTYKSCDQIRIQDYASGPAICNYSICSLCPKNAIIRNSAYSRC